MLTWFPVIPLCWLWHYKNWIAHGKHWFIGWMEHSMSACGLAGSLLIHGCLTWLQCLCTGSGVSSSAMVTSFWAPLGSWVFKQTEWKRMWKIRNKHWWGFCACSAHFSYWELWSVRRLNYFCKQMNNVSDVLWYPWLGFLMVFVCLLANLPDLVICNWPPSR